MTTNEAIYLVIFHCVVGCLYLNIFILLLDLCRVLREESDQSRYMPVILFSELKTNGGYSLCCPLN